MKPNLSYRPQRLQPTGKRGWHWPFLILVALSVAALQPATAQPNITYAEYYIDQDPGFNRATPITITPGTTVTDVPVTFSLNTLTTGAHFFGTRARNASGVWSMNYFWIFFRPYQFTLTPGALTNIDKVEYYIDTDPGIGNGINVPIASPSTNLADLTFSINPGPLGQGVHMIGSRCRTTDGKWSLTNYWLFVKPYPAQATPAAASNVNYVEYFINQDPGLGRATPFSITPGLNLSDVNMPVNIAALPSGVHTIGARARDAGGKWSLTNYWLFVKPYANVNATAIPNVTAVEYYLDYDPGVGRGIPVSITPGTNLADLTFNVDISNIIPGVHDVVIRARDANGNWSKVNSWEFTKAGTPPVLSTIVSATEVCAGGTINVGWQLSSPVTYNANNTFVVQISNGDYNRTFAAPRVIGTTTSTANSGSITCTLPNDLPGGYYYRIRVVSTSQPILGNDNGADIRVNELPPVPNITNPSIDTTVCQGNQLLLDAAYVGYSPQWFRGADPIPGATSWSYSVANATSANAGVYRLRLTNAQVCHVFSAPRTITINTNVPAIPTLSPSGNIGVCLGSSRTLTSSSTSNNQWFRNGVAIPGATGQTFAATTAGTYTVSVGNGTGCFASSSNNAVVTIGLPPVVPTISANGPTTFCQNSSVTLLSSAFSGNQWFRNGEPISSSTSQSLWVNQAGSYTVRVTNGGCDEFSAPIVVTVNNNVTPSVTLATNGNNAPAGTPITFTATATNGGSSPGFEFRVNGTAVQTGSSNLFTSSTLTNGQQVSCVLTSNADCRNQTTASSNTITVSLLSPITISGRVYHPSSAVIPTVSVNITGDSTDSRTTDATGRYSATLFQLRNYTFTPAKNNDDVVAKGVDVLDVLQMQGHILGNPLLTTPYRIVAADVNNDNAVNIFDVIAVKRLILGIDNSFTGKRLWAFVDSSYTFPNPANPFPYKSTRTYTNISSSQINQSFVGVKLGDVNQDWVPTPGQNDALVLPESRTLQLYYDTIVAQRGDQVRLRVKVKNFTELMGMQFTLGFNTASFQFAGIENRMLPVEFNDRLADRGVLPFIWNEPGNSFKTMTDGSALFDIVLVKKAAVATEDVTLVASYTPAKAFAKGYVPFAIRKGSGAILEKMPEAPAVAAETLEVTPNPTRGPVMVTIQSKTAKRVTLVLTDAAGRALLQQPVDLMRGTNRIPLNIRSKAMVNPGMYYLSARGLENNRSRELMIADE